MDLTHFRTQPVHDVISQLVYAAASAQVTDVWVEGQRLLQDQQLTTLDEKQILQCAANWSDRMNSGSRAGQSLLKEPA